MQVNLPELNEKTRSGGPPRAGGGPTGGRTQARHGPNGDPARPEGAHGGPQGPEVPAAPKPSGAITGASHGARRQFFFRLRHVYLHRG